MKQLAFLAIALPLLMTGPPVQTPTSPPSGGPAQGCTCWYEVEVVRIIDADTFVANIQLPWNAGLFDQHIRCLGYDAFEASKRRQSVNVTDEEVIKGKRATEELKELFESAKKVKVSPGSDEFDGRGRNLAWVIVLIKDDDEIKRIKLEDWAEDNGHVRMD